MKHLLFIGLIAGCLVSGHAQSYHTESRRAGRLFEEALEHYRDLEWEETEELLQKALGADERFIEAHRLLSQLYMDQGRIEDAKESFARALELDPAGQPEGYRLLAGLELRTGDYARALELLEHYLDLPPRETSYRREAWDMVRNCRFALRAMENPVPFRPRNLGDSVNSPLSEYWPALSLDGKRLMFTVMVPGEGAPGTRTSVQEDFYESERKDGSWSARKPAGPPLNTPDNEGAHSLTADGSLLFFTACNRRDGQGLCDIYVSRRREGNWSPAVNLGSPVNSPFSEKHPTISADGRVLYFTSNRPGGKGSYDIWKTEWTGREWSVPVNLGDLVNTRGLEQSPFLHPDQRTLYFSSDGWTGMGQGDLFRSRRLERDSGRWSTPVNLGYPINTFNDEIGFSVEATGRQAYFASDRQGRGDTDLYTFPLPEPLQPDPVSYFTGRVYDKGTMRGIRARITLTDLSTGEKVMELYSAQGEGDFLVPLPTRHDYALDVSAEGYLFHSGHFSMTSEHPFSEPFRRDIPLERIRGGSRVVLNNIFFETDSDHLLPESRTELDRVAAFLEDHPSLTVEIGGHTDSTGTSAYNRRLSELRAQAVVGYLTGQGIGEGRLIPKGYGETMPAGDNRTEQGRARNRRTELKILEERP